MTTASENAAAPSVVAPLPSAILRLARFLWRIARLFLPGTPRKLTGMGKFAGILPSSEEFIRQKQEEIELEERMFHR